MFVHNSLQKRLLDTDDEFKLVGCLIVMVINTQVDGVLRYNT